MRTGAGADDMQPTGHAQEPNCSGIIPNPPDGGLSKWTQFAIASRSANQPLRASCGSNLNHFTVVSALLRAMRIADMKTRVQAGANLPKSPTEEQTAAAKLLTDKFAKFEKQLESIDKQLVQWVDQHKLGDLGEQQPPPTGNTQADKEAKIGKLGPPLPAWQV